MLDPKDLSALSDALDQVIAECGDDPQMAPLVDALTAARDAASGADAPAHEGEAAPADHPDNPDAEGDAYSFDHAEKALTEKRKAHG